MKLFKFFFLFVLLISALVGCAVMDEVAEPRATAALTYKAPPAPRELGSLWSTDSKWNDVYAAAAARVVGDIVTIKLDESFRNRIQRTIVGDDPKAAAAKTAPAPAATAGEATPAEAKGSDTSLIVRGSIEEVGSRGIYRITGGDTLRLGEWEPYVVIRGRVRDRDIDASDEVRVADIVDLNFEVLAEAPGAGQEGRKLNHVSW